VLAAAAVTICAASVELVISWSASSLFLVADAVHLVAHLGIFMVLLVPQRGSHAIREDAVTCAVLILVLMIAGGIGVESARALLHPRSPPDASALLFSLFGLAANLVTAWLFRDPAQEHWSFRAALAHELSDASLTVIGIAGAGAIHLFKFSWIDPGLSLAIAVWLGFWSTRLLVRRILIGDAAWDPH
jgi:cobalt-zinc-cadmium efflux system protein